MNQKGKSSKELGKEECGNLCLSLCLHPIQEPPAVTEEEKDILLSWLHSEQESSKKSEHLRISWP